MSNSKIRYNVTIKYWMDEDNDLTGQLEHKNLTGGEVRTLFRKYMDTSEITPMNSLRPFAVAVIPVGWEALAVEAKEARKRSLEAYIEQTA